MATHAIASGMSAFLAFSLMSLGLDSRASFHMPGIKDKIHSFSLSTHMSLSTHISHVNIVDGTLCSVFGKGIVHATSSLSLNNVLYVLKFHVSLLSISQIPKIKNCYVTFFPTYCVFHDF